MTQSAAVARHDVYLRSPAWAAKRAQYKAAHRWECRLCGLKRGGIQLHHLTYERLGVEELDDLLPLCSPCHTLVHAHATENPRLTLRDATFDAIHKYRSLKDLEKRKTAAKRRKRKAERRAKRPTPDLAERFGTTKIRIKPSIESRHGTSG